MTRAFTRLFFILVASIFAINCALETNAGDVSMADSLRRSASNLYDTSQAALIRGALTIRQESAATYEAVSKSVSDWAVVARDTAASYMATVSVSEPNNTPDSGLNSGNKCRPDRVCETSIQ